MARSKTSVDRITFKMTGRRYYSKDSEGELCLVKGFIGSNRKPVGVVSATLHGRMNNPHIYAYMEFVRVEPRWRRRGIATQLIRTCQAKWEDFNLSDACSDAGAALLDALYPQTASSPLTVKGRPARKRAPATGKPRLVPHPAEGGAVAR